MRILGLSVALLGLLAVSPAAAQPSGSDVFSDLLACDPLRDPGERLTCYDSVLRQYKIRFGLLEGSPDELEAEARSRRTMPRGAVARNPVAPPRADAVEEREEAPAETRPSAPRPTERTRRVASPEEFDLPHETTVTAYNANQRGDFRLRVAEGFVFEKAGGPSFSEDPSGKTVTLTKNFLGNWRMEVPGESRQIWVRPVETEGSQARADAGSGSARSADRAAGGRRSPGGEDTARPAASGDAANDPSARRSSGRTASPEDFDLPHETTVTAYNANQRGDFRLRVAEGFVFEKAGGPSFSEDPSGKTVTLTKNFLGNWRLEVPGESRQLWVRPVRQDD